MIEENLYYDEISEEKYSYGNMLSLLRESFHPAMIGYNL